MNLTGCNAKYMFASATKLEKDTIFLHNYKDFFIPVCILCMSDVGFLYSNEGIDVGYPYHILNWGNCIATYH